MRGAWNHFSLEKNAPASPRQVCLRLNRLRQRETWEYTPARRISCKLSALKWREKGSRRALSQLFKPSFALIGDPVPRLCHHQDDFFVAWNGELAGNLRHIRYSCTVLMPSRFPEGTLKDFGRRTVWLSRQRVYAHTLRRARGYALANKGGTIQGTCRTGLVTTTGFAIMARRDSVCVPPNPQRSRSHGAVSACGGGGHGPAWPLVPDRRCNAAAVVTLQIGR
jgi:hypothetical protein